MSKVETAPLEQSTPPPAEAYVQAQREVDAEHEHRSLSERGLALVMSGAIASGVIAASAEKSASREATPAVATAEFGDEDQETGISSAVADKVDNKYQQEFQTDSEDAEATSVQVRDFVSTNKAFFEHPEAIEKVLVTGLASAEDERTTDTSLKEPSDQNKNLATQRGLLAAQSVVDEVKAQFGVDISGKVELGAREDMLNEQELQQVQELAGRFGYKNTREMIDHYNQLGDVPPEASQYLDEVLAQRRGAIIEVLGKEQATQPAPNRAERRQRERERKAEDGAIDRYEGYIPQDKAPIVGPPGVPERPGERFSRVKSQRGSGASIQQGYQNFDPNKDPRRSSEFGLKQKGRPGYHSMNQSRRGRGR